MTAIIAHPLNKATMVGYTIYTIRVVSTTYSIYTLYYRLNAAVNHNTFMYMHVHDVHILS